jgi:hypothetical protein
MEVSFQKGDYSFTERERTGGGASAVEEVVSCYVDLEKRSLAGLRKGNRGGEILKVIWGKPYVFIHVLHEVVVHQILFPLVCGSAIWTLLSHQNMKKKQHLDKEAQTHLQLSHLRQPDTERLDNKHPNSLKHPSSNAPPKKSTLFSHNSDNNNGSHQKVQKLKKKKRKREIPYMLTRS